METHRDNKFPIYGDWVEKNVRRGFEGRELFDRSTIVMSRLLPIIGPNHLIVRDVLDRLTSSNDLSKFCD